MLCYVLDHAEASRRKELGKVVHVSAINIYREQDSIG